jgi:hypothetical protein
VKLVREERCEEVELRLFGRTSKWGDLIPGHILHHGYLLLQCGRFLLKNYRFLDHHSDENLYFKPFSLRKIFSWEIRGSFREFLVIQSDQTSF